jgi:hypothetical protein
MNLPFDAPEPPLTMTTALRPSHLTAKPAARDRGSKWTWSFVRR